MKLKISVIQQENGGKRCHWLTDFCVGSKSWLSPKTTISCSSYFCLNKKKLLHVPSSWFGRKLLLSHKNC